MIPVFVEGQNEPNFMTKEEAIQKYLGGSLTCTQGTPVIKSVHVSITGNITLNIQVVLNANSD